MKKRVKQTILENLPQEILSEKRFFPVYQSKAPMIDAWNLPENQMTAYEALRKASLIGMDICGHDVRPDYFFVDFDHTEDGSGNFIYPEAEKWANYLDIAETYREQSISGTGRHYIFCPTPNLFPKLTGETAGHAIYFDETKKGKDAPKIELFYRQSRYIALTSAGEPNRQVVSGDIADEFCQQLINQISFDTSSIKDLADSTIKPADIAIEEVKKMLTVISCVNASYADWWKTAAILHDTFGTEGFELWRAWSETDKARYTLEACKKTWSYLDKRTSISRAATIASLIFFAKKFGYIPPKKIIRPITMGGYQKEMTCMTICQNIDADTKRELDEAIIRLEALDPDNFTADDAYNPDNLRAVALATAYDYPALAKKFFDAIKTNQARAKIRIADSKSELTAKLTPEEKKALTEIINVGITEIRGCIDRKVSALEKAHAAFLKDEEQKRLRAKYEQQRAERDARNVEIKSRLDQLRAMEPSPERDAEMIQLIRDSCDWHCNRQGVPEYVKATQKNADLIFTYDPTLDGLIGYDEFQQADVFLKSPIWNPNIQKGEEWKDRDDSQLQAYLRKNYIEFNSEKLTLNSVIVYSDAHKFHEVKKYFESLPKHDGKPRAAKLFVKFLGAEDSPYVREVTLNWLTAAVARIFNPGCDYQLAPILLGEQGIGKSYLLDKLGGKWYGALVDDVGDPHAIDAIQKLWLVEIKEMAAMKKDVDANKRFIDSARDTRRQAYARRATTVKRHCVFAITTNNQQCLTDMTGNRRYPIITCHNKPRHYVEGLTDQYIQQVWAEVFAHYQELFKDGFDEKKLVLSRDSQIKSDEIADEHLRDDGLESEIRAYLDIKILPLVLWFLLTREERREFIKNGRLVMVDAVSEFNHRRRARGGRADIVQRDVDAIVSCLTPAQNKHWLRIEHKTIQGNDVDEYILYGSELRQHICAVEIYNEAFGNDKRKSPTRINEILNRIEGWSLGARIRNIDPAYLDQKKVFYRNEE